MEKEFIPYEQALELKKLGFNEPCWGHYTSSGVLQTVEDYNRFGVSISEMISKDFNSESFMKEICKAPLYQQAFRWFREKYKIRFFIQSGMSDLGEFFKVIFPDGEQRNMSYTTYEEAELACLKKLIEIVGTIEHPKHPSVISENGNELLFDKEGNLIKELHK
jgi:hypothetical protein